MTTQEALDYFTRRKEQLGISDKIQQAETLAISALEKQIPKTPLEKEVIGVSITGYKYKGHCPKCSATVSQCTGNYCSKCGQVIDWSENNS